MRCLILLVIALAAVSCDQTEQTEVPPDPKVVQADIRAMHEAIYGEDLDLEALLNLTHPPIIEALGGREAAKAVIGESLAGLRDSGIEAESFDFPSEPIFVSGGERQFAIVPTRTILRSGDRRVESGNFQFGVRSKGETKWTYVEGSRLTPEVLAQLFPDFPQDVTLLETYRRVIEE